MIEKRIALADKRQEFRQQTLSVFRLERQDVPGANAFKRGIGNLVLIGTALAEKRLPRHEYAGKRGTIRNGVPAPNMQILGVDVFKPYVSFNRALTPAATIQVTTLINANVMPDKHILCDKSIIVDMNWRTIITLMPLRVLKTGCLSPLQRNDNLWLRI